MTPHDFIETITPSALTCQHETGIPASFTVGQAALESAWGDSGLTKNANNLFGIKADSSWHGPVITMPTREYLKGEWVTTGANWRKYPDWHECVLDHARFLVNNPRYKGCFQFKDGALFAQAVQAAGYATDPQYAAKIISVINAHDLKSLDHA